MTLYSGQSPNNNISPKLLDEILYSHRFDGGENQLLAENMVELLVKNIFSRGVFRNFL